MKSTVYYCAAALCLGLFASANAAVAPGTWNPITEPDNNAIGSIGGITIRAKTSGSTDFIGVVTNQFGDRWDADFALGNSALGLTTTNVNGGDSQRFTFSSPLLDGTMLYIENFDSNSAANLTADGATNISILSASNVNYASTGGSTGVLTSTNPGYDGNGDVIIVFEGDVTEISLDYTAGDGANGIFYTFADPHAVPEPTSALVMAGLFGLGGVFVYFRRKRQQA